MSDCPRCGADHEAEDAINAAIEKLQAQNPVKHLKCFTEESLQEHDAALRAEGVATERERIAAALEREADEMVDLTKKGLHSPLNAFLRDRAFYARDLAEGLRAGTWPQPALFGGG